MKIDSTNMITATINISEGLKLARVEIYVLLLYIGDLSISKNRFMVFNAIFNNISVL